MTTRRACSGRSGLAGRTLRALCRHAVGFGRDERGSATIEFVIVVPVFLVLFLSTFELGMLMSRHVMLDRGLDMAVRQVRLGQINPPNPADLHEEIKSAICDAATPIIPNCMTQLKLEMRPLNPRSFVNIPADADCIDREDDSIPNRTFTAGISNQLMILRACALFDPYFPTTGLGASLPRRSGGAYALVSVSSFVIEPSS